MEILFVYNANSGLLNAIKDVVHKMTSPNTYSCSLCALTYTTVTENKAWKKFRQTKSSEFVFLHKDEFEKLFPELDVKYPIVLKKKAKDISILMPPKELDATPNTASLIAKLEVLI